MKKLLILVIILLAFGVVNAQKVYCTSFKAELNKKVYVTTIKAEVRPK